MATITGTSATDILNDTGIGDILKGFAGDDTLIATTGNDTLRGHAGDDFMIGGDGNDKLYGGADSDWLRGGAGNDLLDGGTTASSVFQFDYDSADYSQDPAGVTVNLATGTATDGWGDTDTLVSIEQVRGSAFADTLIGGNPANNDFESFRGLAGNDTINGGSGTDRAGYAQDYGRGGQMGIVANLATGTARDGFGDTDTLISIEFLRGSVVSDVLVGDGKNNRFEPLSGNDIVKGGSGKDEVAYHNDHFNTQLGGGKVGIIADLVQGTVRDTSGWQVDQLTSIENVRGSVFNDEIRGNGGGNKLRGEEGDDFIGGRSGADNLFGGRGQDIIRGGGGNDRIDGGSGSDNLRGGNGNDTFVFTNGSDNDRIFDFGKGADKLDVSDFGFATEADVIAAATQVGNHVKIQLDSDDTVVLRNFSLGDLDAGDVII